MSHGIAKHAVLAGLLAAGAGCAEERAPIDWRQPNALEKSFFVGKDLVDPSDDPEFYAQATLVDVNYGAAPGLFTSSYAQKLSRIKWVVEEKFLLARLTYERIDGTDGKGTGAADSDGIVVAAYPIVSHFDVQRQYNPSTGEETNVIVENTTDRPWNERKFMRVDWSKNVNVDTYDFDTLSYLNLAGVDYEPLAYYVNDPNHEDAPHFDLEDGYFDVTTKAFARPEMVRFSWGEMPACWLGADIAGFNGPTASCNPAELTVRHSYRRVVETDYEPAAWDGVRFAAFGAFTTERQGYARNYDMTDDLWRRFINRYNLWERSHWYEDPAKMEGAVACYTPETTPAGSDPHRDLDGNGTEDECEAVGDGSRCDEFKQKCTLPYRDRTAKPVAWYFTTGSDLDYWDGTSWATHEWDVALRSAVMTARYGECVATGGTDCAAKYPVTHGQQDENEAAISLAREVDACRNGLAYQGEDCDALAEKLGAARGASEGVIALAKMEEMVVLCHSPVEANDPEACGGPRLPAHVTSADCAGARESRDEKLLKICGSALEARRGDLRYHQVTVIEEPQDPSPWGIMSDSDDPLTGEKVAASINVWSYQTDKLSQKIVDIARYIRGELRTDEITDGRYVKEWAQAAAAASSSGALGHLTSAEKDQRIAAFARMAVDQLTDIRNNHALDASGLAAARHLDAQLDDVAADVRATSAMAPIYEARRKLAVGTNLEAQLTTPMMQELGGVAGQPLDDFAMQHASPLRGSNPQMIQDLRHKRQLTLAANGSCVIDEAAAPSALADLAVLLEEKFGAFDRDDSKAVQLERAERMRHYLSQRLQLAVIGHEMGHSVGLRHNFVGSGDAFSYHPQYWQLRTKNGTQKAVCTDLDPTGQCVGPRYFDPITEGERSNLIQMFMHGTVMDYPGEYTQDLIGLGVYDFAAARMFYGEVVAVLDDESFEAGTPRGTGMLAKVDNFGGTLGLKPSFGTRDAPGAFEDFHYSQMQNRFELLKNCKDVDPKLYEPADWDEERFGAWHPMFDGLIVEVDGTYTRCETQPVDYVRWSQLRAPITAEDAENPDQVEISWSRSGPAVDPAGRIRVPYGFATDNRADLGNLSVYRHDNGADAYELFDFLITQQELNHIFDNYRRNRRTFSVRNAALGALGRYNVKLRDAAKGLGLFANIFKDRAIQWGYDPDVYWPLIADLFYGDNVLAAGLAFDHFTKVLARPEAGAHYLPTLPGLDGAPVEDGVLRSVVDSNGPIAGEPMLIPNGATGLWGNVGYGGRPLGNALADDKGEYESDYTLNAGSYYEKAFTAYLMTESVDRFISDSRLDFLDARYRSVSMADVFPDAYRRWLANNLTGDDAIKGVHIAADEDGNPLLGEDGYPALGMGWTSWLPAEGPTACFANGQNLLCSDDVEGTVVVDPQVGWEQQKFLIAYTLWFLPENQKQGWLNQMWLWELGKDDDPGFDERIEFHHPTGKVYVARSFGREEIFGKSVEKGISARILQHANELLEKAYVTEAVDRDGDGVTDWYIPVVENGAPLVRYDPAIRWIDEQGREQAGRPGCNATESYACTCTQNRACQALEGYVEVPFFLRETIATYRLGAPGMRGIY